jgi:hypothetical protein
MSINPVPTSPPTKDQKNNSMRSPPSHHFPDGLFGVFFFPFFAPPQFRLYIVAYSFILTRNIWWFLKVSVESAADFPPSNR